MPELQNSPTNGVVAVIDPDAPIKPELPVWNFAAAAEHLRRPFTPEAVRFKVQACYPKADPSKALIVSYIDSRLVTERLNRVCPTLWHDEYEPVPNGLICALTVDGITRRDVGEQSATAPTKGLYSDAFKRASVKFGIGVSLYSIPKIELSLKDGHLRAKDTAKGKTLLITVTGEQACRDRYAKWLADRGAKMFGEPLDHGDTPDSVGDVESQAADDEGDDAGTIGNAIAKKMVDRVWKVEGAKPKLQLAASHAMGVDVGDCSTKPKATEALARLTFEQGQKLDRWISKKETGDDE